MKIHLVYCMVTVNVKRAILSQSGPEFALAALRRSPGELWPAQLSYRSKKG